MPSERRHHGRSLTQPNYPQVFTKPTYPWPELSSGSAMSTSSWSTYQRAWDLLGSFLTQFSISIQLPIQPINLALFVSYLHGKGYAPSTVETYISAVAFIHKLNSMADPASDFLVRKAMQGLHKVHPTTDSRLPISYSVVQKLVDALPNCTSLPYSQSMFRSMFLLAFFAFLRVGEMTLSNGNFRNILALGNVERCITH